MFRRQKHTEAAFRTDLVKHLKLHDAIAVPMESRATTRGLSDLLVLHGGVTALVELKDVHGNAMPTLRPSQRAFCRQVMKQGGNYYRVAQHVSGGHEHYSVQDPHACDSTVVTCTTIEGVALTLIQLMRHREVA